MNDKTFVTVGTFPDPALAYLAKGHLEAAGIPSFIADEHSGWLIGVPTNWPTLQVAQEDALRAIAVLESKVGEAPEEEEAPPEGAITVRDRFGAAGPRHEVPEDDLSAPAYEDERPAVDVRQPEDRAALVERALRAALFGILFWPLLGYSAYLLLKVWESTEPLTPRAFRRAWIALAILGAMSLVFVRLVAGW